MFQSNIKDSLPGTLGLGYTQLIHHVDHGITKTTTNSPNVRLGVKKGIFITPIGTDILNFHGSHQSSRVCYLTHLKNIRQVGSVP